MSAYPEGVTGSEPAITGADMVGRTVTCEGGTVQVVPLSLVQAAVDAVAETWTVGTDLRSTMQAHDRTARIRGGLAEVAEAADIECGFEATLDVTIRGTTMSWECPRCGAHQEQEIPTPEEEPNRD